MLDELNKYDNLGTPRYFFELLSGIGGKGKRWTVRDVQEYFFNRIVDGRNVFDGCLPLAKSIGIITIRRDGLLSLDESFGAFEGEKHLCGKFLERLLSQLESDETFRTIFDSNHISYDVIYRTIQISNAAFQFKYANFKQLLIDFGFLNPHPDQTIERLIVSPKYKRMFDRMLLPGIKKRKVGIDELKNLLEQKQIYGDEAEDFVVDFEQRRLARHANVRNVQKISEYDTTAGYDVVSYETIDSIEINKFIEVKSFGGIPSFYWSRNEIDVAKIKKDKYFLFLVDRNRMREMQYSPIIIRNPYEEIIMNEQKWKLRVEKYFVLQR